MTLPFPQILPTSAEERKHLSLLSFALFQSPKGERQPNTGLSYVGRKKTKIFTGGIVTVVKNGG